MKISREGLSSLDIGALRERYGYNETTPPKRKPWWKQYLEKFNDPIIRILLIAAVVALAVGVIHKEFAEAVGIFIAILLSTGMAFINEYRAGRAFDLLSKVTDDTPYRVIRDNVPVAVPKRELLPGDILLLETGEEIPVDGRLLEVVSFEVDESRLTGESEAVLKTAGDEAGDGKTAYPTNRVYRGSIIKGGHGVVEVASIGDATESGQSMRQATEAREEETPLNLQLTGLSKVIGIVGFGVAFALFGILTVRAAIIGALPMNGSEWTFSAILAGSVLIALACVWVPILCDLVDICARRAVRRPKWLDRGALSWLATLLLGVVVFVVASYIHIKLTGSTLARETAFFTKYGSTFLGFFMISITVIVVSVPEGLAMSVTLSLAYSMRRMIASNNLVRKMHACETIGAVTVICTDKTGTLTKNRMSVFEARMSGLAGDAEEVYRAWAVNSTANLTESEHGGYDVLGNPTEGALLLKLSEAGFDYRRLRDEFLVVKQLTFSTEHKYMATLGESGRLYVKGAPEIVMAFCSSYGNGAGAIVPISDDFKEKEHAAVANFQGRAMRALGFAYIDVAPERRGEEWKSLVQNLTWMGFCAIADPVREDVPQALALCQAAGVSVKMVTGDNYETAKEIGRQISLIKEGEDYASVCMTGPEFAQLTDEQVLGKVGSLKILSRARPSDKLRLVRALQKNNEVVAVTGDGANDAPALNHANVGLVMGQTGTAAAKEAGDIILLDDSFNSIVNAIMWGRSLYANIQRFVLFQLTVNVTALLIAVLGPFLGVEMPLTVTQMLWVNLIMDTLAALALAAEPADKSVMNRPPRKPKSFIITPSMGRGILGRGIFFLLVLILLLKIFEKVGAGHISDHNLSVFFSVFVFIQFWNLFNARAFGTGRSAFHNIGKNKGFLVVALVILVAQILLVQFAGKAFRTTPLSVAEWAVIIGATSLILWVKELIQLIKSKLGKK